MLCNKKISVYANSLDILSPVYVMDTNVSVFVQNELSNEGNIFTYSDMTVLDEASMYLSLSMNKEYSSSIKNIGNSVLVYLWTVRNWMVG